MGEARIAVALAERLGDETAAVPAGDVAPAAAPFDAPGLYAWWADDAGADSLARGLGHRPANPIYAGQAGATRWPSGSRSRATLGSRIATNHLRGNIRSSTFRHTLAACLRGPLRLELAAPDRLTRESNRCLSAWIREHLDVAVAAYHDRDTLGRVEADVLDCLDPPLNLRGMPATPLRARLAQQRRGLHEHH